MIKEKTKTMKE
jgi:hypothetical protein